MPTMPMTVGSPPPFLSLSFFSIISILFLCLLERELLLLFRFRRFFLHGRGFSNQLFVVQMLSDLGEVALLEDFDVVALAQHSPEVVEKVLLEGGSRRGVTQLGAVLHVGGGVHVVLLLLLLLLLSPQNNNKRGILIVFLFLSLVGSFFKKRRERVQR